MASHKANIPWDIVIYAAIAYVIYRVYSDITASLAAGGSGSTSILGSSVSSGAPTYSSAGTYGPIGASGSSLNSVAASYLAQDLSQQQTLNQAVMQRILGAVNSQGVYGPTSPASGYGQVPGYPTLQVGGPPPTYVSGAAPTSPQTVYNPQTPVQPAPSNATPSAAGFLQALSTITKEYQANPTQKERLLLHPQAQAIRSAAAADGVGQLVYNPKLGYSQLEVNGVYY